MAHWGGPEALSSDAVGGRIEVEVRGLVPRPAARRPVEAGARLQVIFEVILEILLSLFFCLLLP